MEGATSCGRDQSWRIALEKLQVLDSDGIEISQSDWQSKLSGEEQPTAVLLTESALLLMLSLCWQKSSSSSSKSVQPVILPPPVKKEWAYVPAGGFKARIVQPRMVNFYKPVYVQNMARVEVPAEDEEVTFVKQRPRIGATQPVGTM